MLAALVPGFVELREPVLFYISFRLFAEYCLPTSLEIAMHVSLVRLGNAAAYITIREGYLGILPKRSRIE
jgi:hypothetical protein